MTKKWAVYNEFDPHAAQWLRNLIATGHIAPGEVDERSIVDVRPDDYRNFGQVHLMAGIGGWSYALRRAGWPDERPVWTASCPCQPFSAAGAGRGTADERHLWPVVFDLIRECQPAVVFGEQVASSLAVGKFSGDGVLSMWQTRQFLNLRKDWLEGFATNGLQRLPELGRAGLFRRSPLGPNREGASAGGRREVSGEGAGSPLRPGCGVGAGAAGGWGVPVERRTVRHDRDAQHEHSVFGQNRRDEGVHEGQHEADSFWSECGSRNLGREEAVRSCCSGSDAATEAIDDLIAEISCEIEGEDGNSWFDALLLDLGRDDYTCGACVAPSAGVGAPHIRQRLYWAAHKLADAESIRLLGRQDDGDSRRRERTSGQGREIDGVACSDGVALGDPISAGLAQRVGIRGVPGRALGTLAREAAVGAGVHADGLEHAARDGRVERWSEPGERGAAAGCGAEFLADADGGDAGAEFEGWRLLGDLFGDAEPDDHGLVPDDFGADGAALHPGPVNGLWADADWLYCTDAKWRPVMPGSFPLADGLSFKLGSGGAFEGKSRAKMLKGYGNAINAEQAKIFIEVATECFFPVIDL